MKVFLLKIKLRAPWVHSLKEKRMIVRSIIQRLKNTFNISVAEVEEQDVHQTIVIGITGIGANNAQVDSIIDNIISFVESSTEAEVVNIETEIIY